MLLLRSNGSGPPNRIRSLLVSLEEADPCELRQNRSLNDDVN